VYNCDNIETAFSAEISKSKNDLDGGGRMSKHTPGPWVYDGCWQDIVSCDGKIIAFASLDGEQSEYDARLIAAAPELLEALEELSLLMDDVRNGEYTPDHLTTQPARAAIAKAKGEK
jgi:hypothetical protein